MTVVSSLIKHPYIRKLPVPFQGHVAEAKTARHAGSGSRFLLSVRDLACGGLVLQVP